MTDDGNSGATKLSIDWFSLSYTLPSSLYHCVTKYTSYLSSKSDVWKFMEMFQQVSSTPDFEGLTVCNVDEVLVI